MTRFIKLTGAKSGRTTFARAEEVQAAFGHAEFKNCSIVVLRGGTTMHVRETPDEILALLQAPVDPSEPS